jgi:hypothetical protein
MSERANYDLPDYPDRNWTGSSQETTRRQETSRRFHDLMDAAMMVSFHKYGAVAEAYPEKVNALDSMQLRLKLYAEGKRNPDAEEPGQPEFLVPPGNVEYLVDAANFAMIEFMHPAHPKAYFKATDAGGSPGRVAQNKELYERPTQFKNASLAGVDGNL